MTYEQIFAGRIALLGAQRHLANRMCRYDSKGELQCESKPEREALAIVAGALSELAREFTAKRARACRSAA